LLRFWRVRVLTGAHPLTRRGRWTGLAAFALWALGPTRLAGQLAVDQAELFLQPQAASASAASFNVRNESDQVVEATVYLMDWDRAEDGDNRFVPSGTLPQSCAPYLKIFPLSLRLPPGSSQMVRLGMEGTDSLAATCWSIVFVESGQGAPPPGRHIAYVMRIGVKVYITPSGLPRDGDVEAMTVDSTTAKRSHSAKDTAAAPHLRVSYRNTGGVPYWVRGSVEYRRLDNSVARADSIGAFPILPGARRRFAMLVPALPAGQYVALVLLDYGGSELAAGQILVEAR